MSDFNSDVAILTIQRVIRILDENNIQYRFLGSVVVAAINGKLHRELGDLDLVIDSKGKDILYLKLKELGYKPAKGMFTFARRYLCLETLEHNSLLGIGYFYGTWQTKGSFRMGNEQISVSIEPFAVKETKYILHGVKFVGIPNRASATGVFSSKTNPKRKRELELLRAKRIEPFPNNYIHISVYGMKADWIYHLSMKILNTIGEIRVKMGLAFDPWR